MICPKCGNKNVSVQTVSEQKGRSCLSALMWILFAICTFGLILFIPLLTRKKSKTKTYAICQNCGYRWKV